MGTTHLAAQETTGSAETLIGMLSKSLGRQVAAQAVHDACRTLGLATSALSQEQALQVLEAISRADGLVGLSARLAKSRVILQWN